MSNEKYGNLKAIDEGERIQSKTRNRQLCSPFTSTLEDMKHREHLKGVIEMMERKRGEVQRQRDEIEKEMLIMMKEGAHESERRPKSLLLKEERHGSLKRARFRNSRGNESAMLSEAQRIEDDEDVASSYLINTINRKKSEDQCQRMSPEHRNDVTQASRHGNSSPPPGRLSILREAMEELYHHQAMEAKYFYSNDASRAMGMDMETCGAQNSGINSQMCDYDDDRIAMIVKTSNSLESNRSLHDSSAVDVDAIGRDSFHVLDRERFSEQEAVELLHVRSEMGVGGGMHNEPYSYGDSAHHDFNDHRLLASAIDPDIVAAAASGVISGVSTDPSTSNLLLSDDHLLIRTPQCTCPRGHDIHRDEALTESFTCVVCQARVQVAFTCHECDWLACISCVFHSSECDGS
mmetsp:Transcript_10317/g.14385  ORF Transcript_10317/g.14385 Transcript_10317/m.14385 type:complete len:406 (-) Transcript_10317:20-1237(-)